MAIALYGAMANGGKIVQLDDPAVTRDHALADLTSGFAYDPVPSFRSARWKVTEGWGKFRRLVQRIYQSSQALVTLRVLRDSQVAGADMFRSINLTQRPLLVIPVNVLGTEFQIEVEVTGFDAPFAFGSGEVWVVPRRR